MRRPSLQGTLAAWIVERGRADFEEVARAFPHMGRQLLQRTLHNACAAGLIVSESRGKGTMYGTLVPAVYRAPKPGEGKVRRVTQTERDRVASVWDLGCPRPVVLSPIPGRKYRPLGDWSDA